MFMFTPRITVRSRPMGAFNLLFNKASCPGSGGIRDRSPRTDRWTPGGRIAPRESTEAERLKGWPDLLPATPFVPPRAPVLHPGVQSLPGGSAPSEGQGVRLLLPN